MTAVFVIEDQAPVRDALAEMLRVFGFSVEVFETADQLLRTINSRRAGCVVADVRMPGMSGIELVQEPSPQDPTSGSAILRLRRRSNGGRRHQGWRRGFYRETYR